MSQISNSTVTNQQITQLTAINIAKAITILCLIGCAVLLGVSGMRQVLYLSLHISYCVWWLSEQWLFPKRRELLFKEPAGIGGLISIILIVGIFYGLPGYLAFLNPQPIALVTVAIALVFYIFGSLINASADVQKLTAKEFGAGLVQDNIWRLSRNINYFGDLLRYLSFAIVAGSSWAYLVPGLVATLYLQRMAQKDQGMEDKYSEYAEYQKHTARLIPFIW
ncbi:MAG: DUF1295 domain-containing protein [Oscillatoriales cyanobacterium RM1_1_9]|nr:DUF1295 domain-containing protein [Oscillatoriales cyanobacterium SM2_3_0]NJO44965.1 DUF1295 domain-containing protein [Oscillatoriales cyanobacterium RM2_1_1]NJO71457.1 DUF1295 domain-containing protein [Oscillatoriales cyanobacterium RM1_1_9]